jgi:outer membrane receptor protein involved in Fe transport
VDVGGAADGVSGLPAVAAVKLIASVNYQVTDALSLFVQERFRGPLRQNGGTGAAAVYFVEGMVAPVAYTDFTINYNVNKDLQVYFNVQNLFNQNPPGWSSAGATVQMNYLSGYPLGDDIEGRFMTLGFRFKM